MRKKSRYENRPATVFFYCLNLLVEGKYKLLGSTFPEKLIYKEGRVRTIGDSTFIPNFLKNGAAFSRKKNKGSDKTDPLSHRVNPMVQISNRIVEGLRLLL